ncbi:MAG: bifunctional nicotinamidase/pyrazinamidase [Alphaproteobacteria bacterium]|nr:bifunctional nicotinamidase/pyrazinamidase [Alphaproteobacteria bacterium]
MPHITPGEGDILLIIDVQNDFCDGGALAVPDGDAVVPAINRLAGEFPHMAMTQDWHPSDHLSFASAHPGKKPFETILLPYGEQVLWPDHCVQDSDGAAFHRALDLPRVELIVRKGFRRAIDSYSAFFENDRRTPTGLAGYLRDRTIDRIFFCGLATDFCVSFTAVDAHKAGFEAVLIDPACRAIDRDGSLAAARVAMADAGVITASMSDFGL